MEVVSFELRSLYPPGKEHQQSIANRQRDRPNVITKSKILAIGEKRTDAGLRVLVST